MERRPYGDRAVDGSCGTFIFTGVWRVWRQGDDTARAPGVTHDRNVALDILAGYLHDGFVTPRCDPDFVDSSDNTPFIPAKLDGTPESPVSE